MTLLISENWRRVTVAVVATVALVALGIAIGSVSSSSGSTSTPAQTVTATRTVTVHRTGGDDAGVVGAGDQAQGSAERQRNAGPWPAAPAPSHPPAQQATQERAWPARRTHATTKRK